MSLYKRGEIFWIALRHRGRRVRRSTGTTDRQAAKRQHDELAAPSMTELVLHTLSPGTGVGLNAHAPTGDRADTARIGASGMTTPIHVNEKTLAAIKGGRPVARSTLRKALLAARQASGSMFDVDAYIVDQRTAQSR